MLVLDSIQINLKKSISLLFSLSYLLEFCFHYGHINLNMLFGCSVLLFWFWWSLLYSLGLFCIPLWLLLASAFGSFLTYLETMVYSIVFDLYFLSPNGKMIYFQSSSECFRFHCLSTTAIQFTHNQNFINVLQYLCRKFWVCQGHCKRCAWLGSRKNFRLSW